MNSILEINNLSKSYHTLNGEINTLEDNKYSRALKELLELIANE